jgi:hypothetical protein
MSRIHHIFAQLVLRLVKTGCIDEYNLKILPGYHGPYIMARGLRLIRHDGDLFSGQKV